jgi:hypothetical protein
MVKEGWGLYIHARGLYDSASGGGDKTNEIVFGSSPYIQITPGSRDGITDIKNKNEKTSRP